MAMCKYRIGCPDYKPNEKREDKSQLCHYASDEFRESNCPVYRSKVSAALDRLCDKLEGIHGNSFRNRNG